MHAQYLRLRVPVWASNRDVIREARRMLSSEGKSRAMRDARRAWFREMLSEHEAALREYFVAMGGSHA